MGCTHLSSGNGYLWSTLVPFAILTRRPGSAAKHKSMLVTDSGNMRRRPWMKEIHYSTSEREPPSSCSKILRSKTHFMLWRLLRAKMRWRTCHVQLQIVFTQRYQNMQSVLVWNSKPPPESHDNMRPGCVF